MKKRILCSLTAAMIMATSIPAAFAANVPPAPTSCGEREIVPYADVIIYRYRIENGTAVGTRPEDIGLILIGSMFQAVNKTVVRRKGLMPMIALKNPHKSKGWQPCH